MKTTIITAFILAAAIACEASCTAGDTNVTTLVTGITGLPETTDDTSATSTSTDATPTTGDEATSTTTASPTTGEDTTTTTDGETTSVNATAGWPDGCLPPPPKPDDPDPYTCDLAPAADSFCTYLAESCAAHQIEQVYCDITIAKCEADEQRCKVCAYLAITCPQVGLDCGEHLMDECACVAEVAL